MTRRRLWGERPGAYPRWRFVTRRGVLSQVFIVGTLCACAPETEGSAEPRDSETDDIDTETGADTSTGTDTEDSGSGQLARCGDGVRDADEACDLGVGNEVGAECTPTCQVPTCGDDVLTPLEACDGSAVRHPEVIGPWTCGSDCQWRSPFVWLDSWADHDGHDDHVVKVEAGDDDIVRALGAQGIDAASSWFVRALDTDGQRLWEHPVSDGPCASEQQPSLALAGSQTAVFAAACKQATAVLQTWDVDGEPVWSESFGDDDILAMGLWGIPSGFLVYIARDAEEVELTLRFVDLTGETQWETPLEEPVWASVADQDQETLLGLGPETLWSRRLSDGSLIQQTALLSPAAAAEADGSGGLIVARRPSSAALPFVLERYDGDLERTWSTEVDTPAIPLRRKFGVAVRDGEIAFGLERRDPLLGTFDTHVSVQIFSEAGMLTETLALQGPANARDFALDVALTASGDVIAAGALSHPDTGLDGFVAQLDRSAADAPPHAVPIPTPNHPPRSFVRPPGPTPRTLFIDASGPTLRPGDDPTAAEVSCIDSAFGYPALSWDPQLLEDALDVAREILEPFAVRLVTTEPPPYLPYTRVLVGGEAASLGSGSTHRGLACRIDCGDADLVESVFVFGEAASRPEDLAQTIAHEFGHAVGLDHIEDSGALMHPVSSSQSSAIQDTCVDLVENACESEHATHCGPGQQNSYAELLAAVGAPPGDSEAPQIGIDAPASTEARAVVGVEVEVSDDTPGYGWQLCVPELGWCAEGSTEGQGSFELNLPPGQWTLEVEATDQLGNVGRESASVVVEELEGEAGG